MKLNLNLLRGAFWLLLITFFGCPTVIGQEKGAFSTEPANLVAGETAIIKYDPATTVLKGKDHIKGVIYLFRDFKWIADDLKMQKKGEVWEASYHLPEVAALMTCKFSSGNIIDHGGKVTYSWFVGRKDPSKGPVPGSYIGWGLLRNNAVREQKPSFISPESYIENNVVVFWINQELKNSPVSRRPMFPLVMEFLQATDTLRALKAAPREASALLTQPNLSEEELLTVMNVYRKLLKRTVSADSLEQVILTKFPKGSLALDKEITAIHQEQDPIARLARWEKCKSTFPSAQLKYGRSQVMRSIYPDLLKKIIVNRLAQSDAVEDLKSDIDVAPYYLLAELETLLIKEGEKGGKKIRKKFSPFAQHLKSEIEEASEDRMIPESRLFSPLEWKVSILDRSPALYQAVVQFNEKEN